MDDMLSEKRRIKAVDFVSLGMVVLDELRFPSKAPLLDVMGGSGTYATLGARLFASDERSDTVGCLVLAGNDFPEAVENTLRDWGIKLVLKKDTGRLSTRGLLQYEDTTFGPKDFSYTTEPMTPAISDLMGTPLLRSRCYHFLSTPDQIVRQINELLALRQLHSVYSRPLIVWEPFPAACIPGNLTATMEACKHVDMFSPNHFEITRLFTDEDPNTFQPFNLESCAQKFLDHGIGDGGKGCIVIRAAENGCLTASRAEGLVWSPSFYGPDSDAARVVDPTGAGNAFIGSFMSALVQHLTLVEAASCGNVAASFALEQIGVPKRDYNGVRESWNGVSVMDRLEEYKFRTGYIEKKKDSAPLFRIVGSSVAR
ncbi:hypothetical protein VTL71DRAFT_3697 [Oculimacula yallundae]|uniref:Carbohydrate kinase PfkB domain-containing protein n=1 Tax=Oculimacula yallundae TaxID=86028 RepID=A0ABR4C3Q1_9HELO